jgi:DNA-binding NtrC family response regulator
MNTSNENRKRGSFHNDLYYRLNTIHIKMPSLREMQDDIPLLANYFLNSFTGELGRNSMRFSPYLLNYGWPGNVRELENEVKRAAILADRDIIEQGDLSEHIRDVLESRGGSRTAPTEEGNQFLKGTVEEIEIRMIKGALQRSRGNKQ